MPVLLSFWQGTALQSTLTSVINCKCIPVCQYLPIYGKGGFVPPPPPLFFFRLSISLTPHPLKLISILRLARLCQCNTALVGLCPLSCKAWSGSAIEGEHLVLCQGNWRGPERQSTLHFTKRMCFQQFRLMLFPSLPAPSSADGRGYIHTFMALKKYHFQRPESSTQFGTKPKC